MKQIYYVIQTLLRGRGSNIIKVISLGLGLTMSILLFSRVAYEQSFDTCFKDYDNLYQVWSIFSVKGRGLSLRVELRSRGRGYFGELPQRGGVGGKFEHVYGICSPLQWKRAS